MIKYFTPFILFSVMIFGCCCPDSFTASSGKKIAKVICNVLTVQEKAEG